MSSSPPSMYGSVQEPPKACNRRKKTKQIVTTESYDCGSLIASRFTGTSENPSQAISALTDDTTVSVSKNPAIKREVSIV